MYVGWIFALDYSGLTALGRSTAWDVLSAESGCECSVLHYSVLQLKRVFTTRFQLG